MSGRDAYRQQPVTNAERQAGTERSSGNDAGPLSPYYARAYAAAQHGLGYLAAGAVNTISATANRSDHVDTADSSDAARLPRTSVISTTPELASVAVGIGRSASNDATSAMDKVASSSADADARRKDSRNLDSIIAQAHTKAAQIIAQARLTHPPGNADDQRSGASAGRISASSASASAKKARNRWVSGAIVPTRRACEC